MHTESDTVMRNRRRSEGLCRSPGWFHATPASFKYHVHPAMSSGSKKIRVLLADDHVIMRVGLSEIIQRESDMEMVAEAGDGIEAVDAYRRYRPDVVIMDLRMPRQGGVATICILLEEYPDARILVYSNSTSREQIHASFNGGARGFVNKSMSLEDLLKGVRAVSQGNYYIPTQILACLGLNSALNLTSREMGILALVAKGMSNKEIGTEMHLAERAVKTHMTGILAKMEVSDRNQAVLVGVRRGLLQVV